MIDCWKDKVIFSPRIFRNEHIRQQEEFWKSQHPEYAALLQRIGQLEAELSSLKNNNA